jgi:hypothetical protein
VLQPEDGTHHSDHPLLSTMVTWPSVLKGASIQFQDRRELAMFGHKDSHRQTAKLSLLQDRVTLQLPSWPFTYNLVGAIRDSRRQNSRHCF